MRADVNVADNLVKARSLIVMDWKDKPVLVTSGANFLGCEPVEKLQRWAQTER